MATTLRQTQIFEGNTILPTTTTLIGGAIAAPIKEYFNNASGIRLNTGMAFGTYGGRITFGSAQNMSTRKYVQFSIMSQLYAWVTMLNTVANGGLRIYFLDGSGNYIGWKIYGSNVKNYNYNYNYGFPVHYQDPDDAINGAEWIIARSRTPDYSSGTLNWAAVTAVEIQMAYAQASPFGDTALAVYLRWLGTFDPHLATGTGNTFADMENTVQNPGGWAWKRNFQRTNYQWFALPTVPYASKVEIAIGDGSTVTEFTDSACALALWNRYEDDSGPTQSLGPCVLVAGNDRPIVINQTSTCNTTLSDMTWSSSSGWSLTIQGNASGTALFTRNQFWRAEYITGAHGQFVDCIFDACKTVNLTASTILTGSVIRNANGVGIKLTAAPGDYSAKTFSVANNTGYDIVIDPASAGTFTLGGLSAAGGYTVKIRNASATHAITVAIPAGVTYSTSTAGGSITVSTPATTLTVAGIVNGSRILIRRTDTLAVLVNAVVSGTSYAYSYNYSTADPVEIVLRKATGSPTYKQYRTTATLTASNVTLTASQELDE